MSVNLSIKNVPDVLAERLRERARRSHRSLQGELMAVLEEAVAPRPRLTARQLLDKLRGLDLETGADSLGMIRADRDAR